MDPRIREDDRKEKEKSKAGFRGAKPGFA